MSLENRGKISRGNFIKIGSAFALAVTGAVSCVEPTISPNAWDPTTVPATETVVPPLLNGEINTITDQARIQELINSLPEDKPSISEVFPPQAFEIKVSNLTLPFVIYDIGKIDDMQLIKTNIPDRGDSYTLQNVALFAPIVQKDGSFEMTRLAATILPGENATKNSQVIWYYQPEGFPDPEAETDVDLSRPALLYEILATTGTADCQAYYEPSFASDTTKPANWDGRLLQINTCVTEPTATKSLLSPISPVQLFEVARETYPDVENWGWDEKTGLFAASLDNKTSLIYDFTKNEWIKLLTEPTADELAFAKKDTVAPEFTFGGYKWNATVNENNEKVWVREDGKINFEWVSLYGGEIYNAYMFVTRSERVEGKRSVEVYSDPRAPLFTLITGDPNAIDTFVGTTVANFMKGDVAQTALRQEGSTLKIIWGGSEYWPLGSRSTKLRPDDISYLGPNGEKMWQKIWSIYAVGSIGPFVEPANNAVQCGYFNDQEYFDLWPEYIKENPADEVLVVPAIIRTAIDSCTYLDPKDSNPTTVSDFTMTFVKPVFSGEKIDLK